MADLDKAIAAAREALTMTGDYADPPGYALRDLIAALDAQPKAGEVWQYCTGPSSRGKEWIDCRDEQIARQMEALGFEIRCLYAAPPAALAVPRFTDIEAAARYGWEHASWEWENVRIGLGEQAPPAAAVPEGLRNAEQTLALLIRKHGDEADAAALAMLAQQPAAAVPEGYVVVPVEPTEAMLDEGGKWTDAYAVWAAMLAAANKENTNG